MENIQTPPISRAQRLVALGIAAVAVLTLFSYGAGAIAGKMPDLGRALVAVFGLVAAAMVVFDIRPGALDCRLVALAWAIVQIPIFAMSPDGPPNTQIFSIPLVGVESTKLNGVLTYYREYGINVAPFLFIWIIRKFVPTRELLRRMSEIRRINEAENIPR